ncbi:MAG: hypothetical protein ACM3YM_04955 [Sphingomonadales bacterium]
MSFQEKLKRPALRIALAGLLAAEAGSASCQDLVTAQANDFDASGSVIEGWTWLRAHGDSARWHWNAVPATPTEACVDFSLLVTNRASGGSGHDARARVSMVSDDGMTTETATLKLINPFRPVVDSDTAGIGYQAHGALCPSDLGYLASRGFTLEMHWTAGTGGHIAVRHEGALLAYVR